MKQACDAFALDKAYSLRAFSLHPGLQWRARRWAKFLAQYAVGTLRKQRFALPQTEPNMPTATEAGLRL